MTKYVFLGLKGLFSVLFAVIAAFKLMQAPPLMESLAALGYPAFLVPLLGVAYAAGIIGIWQPISATVKEWAFAGYSFALLGALSSHILAGDPVSAFAPSIILLTLLVAVYWLEKTNAKAA